jgi:acid phosphatase (class A)
MEFKAAEGKVWEDKMKLKRSRSVLAYVFVVWAIVAMAWAVGRSEEPVKPAVPVKGYLSAGELPESLRLIPPPPVEGSAAVILDEQVSRKAFTLRGSSAWTLATEDADLAFPHVVNAFTCALGAQITERDTPRLYLLMRRSYVDAVTSTFAPKDKYARPRPFMVNKLPTCSPAEEARMTKSGSYPSGHSSLGWAWALILSEVSPEQTNALLVRGRAFAQGRIVCNVHWQSDIIEGMIVGTATVARLHGNPEFRADVEAAKAELADIRKKGLKATGNCKLEGEADTVRATQLP